ncbi:MAG: aspartate aminotransferase family protein [Ruegeria sp.]
MLGHNTHPISESLFRRAAEVLPGGTTRATIERNPVPIYAERGEGPWLIDVDGNRYLDLNNNFTTLIHGHGFAPVVEAVTRQLQLGTCFANPTESEVELAELLCSRVPSIDQVRFVNTGTEAVMFAIKAARAKTGRPKIAKLEGAYHGAYDWAETSLNSSPANWGEAHPASVAVAKGTPVSVLDEVVALPMNDIAATEDLLQQHGSEIACVLIDLVPSRAGLIPLDPNFVKSLREVTERLGILLVSDEVLNFRQGYHGAAARFDLKPDLITMGKIIGGGLPIGAIGGSSEAMSVFDNSTGPAALPQGGTFSANPLSMVAGLSAMQALDEQAFADLEAMGDAARQGLTKLFKQTGLPLCVTGSASLTRIHASSRPPRNYRESYLTPTKAEFFKTLSRSLQSRGASPCGGSLIVLSTAMHDVHIEHLLTAFSEALREDEKLLRLGAQLMKEEKGNGHNG